MADVGRPSSYETSFCDSIKEPAAAGATDDELADILGVHRSTLYRWRNQHPEFRDALKAAKDPANARVVRTLYQKAVGYYVTEQQAIKVKTGQYTEEVQIVEVQRYVPPDTTADIFWLKNRDKENWRDKQEVEHTGRVVSAIESVIVDPKASDPHSEGVRPSAEAEPL